MLSSILILLGILDIIAGIILTLSGFPIFNSNFFVSVFAIIMMGKGGYSWLHNLASPTGTKLDFMGILDILTGIMLFFVFTGAYLFLFPYFGILILLKGIYSMFIGATG